ncbi:type II toxin-antitoxin system HicB family antitoxin [Bosea sp. BK604]|uniref:type II toxin-antitoxin system HicB family antitoxin n=1 Tax=Bosea sp. BK604 TaxID=2512180 RepID=UPI001045F673|nr:type II toxin-antitoxin system HicB family antitoxin [Bosea sp. BK604]TCR69708.1 putative RNase H-like HicB family nuclease [Bosea sp. BK604]
MRHVVGLIHQEGESFGISFPDFPGCISTADTFNDIILRGEQALRFHIEGMIEDGEAMPLLSTPGDIVRALGGKLEGGTLVTLRIEVPEKAVRINVTIDEALLDAIDRSAAAEGSTRSGYLAKAALARIMGR